MKQGQTYKERLLAFQRFQKEWVIPNIEMLKRQLNAASNAFHEGDLPGAWFFITCAARYADKVLSYMNDATGI